MPDEFTTVYLKDTGEPAQMHSVDAAEAMRIGDYVLSPPKGKEMNAEELAQMRARAAGIGTATHPELQTPEEREETRRVANEAAADAAARTRVMQGLPPMAPAMMPRGHAADPDVHHVADPDVHHASTVTRSQTSPASEKK